MILILPTNVLAPVEIHQIIKELARRTRDGEDVERVLGSPRGWGWGCTMPDWPALAAQLKAATGPNAEFDTAIAEVFGVPAAGYTGSVEDCRRLVAQALPGWRLHVGFGVSGVFPYAVVSKGEDRAEAEAATVPLAILRAVVEMNSRCTVIPYSRLTQIR